MADFAAPLPFQSGGNWLWNRVATDVGLLAGGAAHGIGAVAKAVKNNTPLVNDKMLGNVANNIRDVYKTRGRMLDELDAAGNLKGQLRQQGSNARVTSSIKNPRLQPEQLNELRVGSPMKDASNLRREVDYLPEQAVDGRTRYNFPTNEVSPMDMRKYNNIRR
jgi:hypothetical protein